MKAGAGGGGSMIGRWLVEAFGVVVGEEKGRGSGGSYSDGPSCRRMYKCESVSMSCSALYTGRLSSTRMFHLRRGITVNRRA